MDCIASKIYSGRFRRTHKATAAIIAGGDRRGPAGWFLALRPVRWFGRISYSLYLWHWPILVLPVLALGRELSAAERVALAAIAVVRAQRLLESAEVACAMSFEVCRADLGCVSELALEAREAGEIDPEVELWNLHHPLLKGRAHEREQGRKGQGGSESRHR